MSFSGAVTTPTKRSYPHGKKSRKKRKGASDAGDELGQYHRKLRGTVDGHGTEQVKTCHVKLKLMESRKNCHVLHAQTLEQQEPLPMGPTLGQEVSTERCIGGKGDKLSGPPSFVT